MGISILFGTSEGLVDQHHAFLYDNGKMQLLPTLSGARLTWPEAINKKSGVIVGARTINPEETYNDWRAMVWIGGQPVDLTSLLPPNSGWTLYFAYAVNDAGQITGYGYNSNQGTIHAFLLTPVESKGNQ